jgi:hypothetical protein
MNADRDDLLNISKEYNNAPFDFFDSRTLFATHDAPKEPDLPQPPPKKKKKLGRALWGTAKVLMVLAILAVTAYTLLAGSKQQMGEDSFSLRTGNYGKNPVWLADADSTAAKEIFEAMPQNGALQTAYDIYVLACQRLSLSKEYSVRAKGYIDLMSGEIVASGVSNREEHYYVIGEPTLDANQPRLYSNYDINFSLDGKGNDTIVAIFQVMMMSGVRSYFDGEKVYEQRSKSLSKDENDIFVAEWRSDYVVLEKDFERGYQDGELREKTNFIVSLDTILPDSVKVEQKTVNGEKVYDVSFKLDCSTSSLGSATYYEAEAIKRKMGNTREFVYNYLDINFSVYENGYMFYWATKQRYSVEYVLMGSMGMEIAAEMNKEEYLSYDPEECNVVNFLQAG